MNPRFTVNRRGERDKDTRARQGEAGQYLLWRENKAAPFPGNSFARLSHAPAGSPQNGTSSGWGCPRCLGRLPCVGEGEVAGSGRGSSTTPCYLPWPQLPLKPVRWFTPFDTPRKQLRRLHSQRQRGNNMDGEGSAAEWVTRASQLLVSQTGFRGGAYGASSAG
jgi:hypothetical protein